LLLKTNEIMIAKMVLLGLMTLSLGIGLATHGKEKKPQNGWVSLINYIITLSLLYWCGLFDSF
tara:strand:- start:297 stop:485 length:189 start_codon:yes stop_codon:yes gene_type:complete